MKKTLSTILTTMLFAMLICTGKVHAQLLKNVLKSAKNTAESRADNAASTATNKALDKVDPTVKKSNNGANTPNSSGKVMGGNGLSAADSAKALAAFKSTGNSSNTRCVYYEITNSATTDEGKTISTISKHWFTSDGRVRGEMNLAELIADAAGYHINAKPVVIISRANMPNYGVELNDEDKTYSLNLIDQALLDKAGEGYTAYVIGTENVNGYSCKHAVVKGDKMVMDMWMSTDVPGYDVYKKAAATSGSGADGSYMSALKAAGVEGFPVKIFEEISSVSRTLTKATYIGVSNSFFEIPSGYTKAPYDGVITNLMEAGQSKQQ